MTDLSQLLEKVRTATAGSRELDWLIADALNIPEEWPESTIWPPFMKTSKFDKAIPYFTTSLDAIAALIERDLPGWQYAMGTCNEDDSPWACITEPDEPCRDFTGAAPDIPLALVEAFLSALSAAQVKPMEAGGAKPS